MTLTRPDQFFADTRPAGELPDVPTEIPRHRGKGKQPWIRNPDDASPAPAVVQERHSDGSLVTVLADPKDSRRGKYVSRASKFGDLLEDKHNIHEAEKDRVVYGMGRHPELVMQAQAVESYEDGRGELKAIGRKAVEYAKGAAASTKGTAFHRLRERRDAGEDLSYLDPLTLQGLATWERLVSPFELIGSEQFVVNDELEAGGSYDALLKLICTLTVRHPKTGEVLGVLERGEVIVGDLKSGRWGPKYFGPTYGCQGLVYSSGVPYTHDGGRAQWPGGQQPSQRWAVIPYVSLDPAAPPAGLYWIDLDKARRAVAAVAEVRAIRADKLMFVAHQEDPMPVDLAAAGQRAVGGPFDVLENQRRYGKATLIVGSSAHLFVQIAEADGKVALSRLWAQHADIWTPEHTDAGQARLVELARLAQLAQLAGGAS